MSYRDLIEEITFESAKTNFDAHFEMSLEDYFDAPAELTDTFEALQTLADEEQRLNAVIDKLTPVVGELSPVALAVINEVIAVQSPIMAIRETFITLDVEEAKDGEEPKKEKAADKKSLGDRAKKIKDQAMRYLAKVYNMIADFVRKFRTGTDKLQENIKSVMDKVKGDIVIDKAPVDFQFDGKTVTAKNFEEMSKDHHEALKVAGSGDFELKMLGGGTTKVSVTDGKVKIEKTKGKDKVAKVTLSESEAKALLQGAADLAKSIGDINHKGITKLIDGKAKKAIDENGSMADVNNLASVLRTLTVSYPSAVAKSLATIYSAISKQVNGGDNKDDNK